MSASVQVITIHEQLLAVLHYRDVTRSPCRTQVLSDAITESLWAYVVVVHYATLSLYVQDLKDSNR